MSLKILLLYFCKYSMLIAVQAHMYLENVGLKNQELTGFLIDALSSASVWLMFEERRFDRLTVSS